LLLEYHPSILQRPFTPTLSPARERKYVVRTSCEINQNSNQTYLKFPLTHSLSPGGERGRERGAKCVRDKFSE